MTAKLDQSLSDIIKLGSSSGPVRTLKKNSGSTQSPYARPSRPQPFTRPQHSARPQPSSFVQVQPSGYRTFSSTPARAPIAFGGTSSVFIGNLSPQVTWQALKDLMRAAGSVRRVEVQNAGKPYATVEFDDARSAQNAIAMFNNYNFEGRTIHVREDREAGGASLATPNQESRILVSNLPFRAEWQELKDLCAPYGTVVRADVDVLPDGRSKGSGTVVFASQADAWACIRGLNGQTVEGRILGVHADNHYGALAPAARHSGAPIAPVQSDQNARIFISNLPFRAEWQELKDLCAPYGTVVRADVDELPDGRSKGTGTVVFASQADAWSCIRGLNGQTVEGRVLGVHADNHHPSNGQSGTPLAGFKVYGGNLPWSCSWQNLKDLGRPFGEVSFADLALEPSGRSRGFGVLTFSHANSAQACIKNLHGTIFEDRDLVVHEDSRA